MSWDEHDVARYCNSPLLALHYMDTQATGKLHPSSIRMIFVIFRRLNIQGSELPGGPLI